MESTQLPISKCKLHPDQDLVLFCENEECNKFICPICTTSHKGHNIAHYSAFVAALKLKIEQNIDKWSKDKQKLTVMLKRIAESMKKVNEVTRIKQLELQGVMQSVVNSAKKLENDQKVIRAKAIDSMTKFVGNAENSMGELAKKLDIYKNLTETIESGPSLAKVINLKGKMDEILKIPIQIENIEKGYQEIEEELQKIEFPECSKFICENILLDAKEKYENELALKIKRELNIIIESELHEKDAQVMVISQKVSKLENSLVTDKKDEKISELNEKVKMLEKTDLNQKHKIDELENKIGILSQENSKKDAQIEILFEKIKVLETEAKSTNKKLVEISEIIANHTAKLQEENNIYESLKVQIDGVEKKAISHVEKLKYLEDNIKFTSPHKEYEFLNNGMTVRRISGGISDLAIYSKYGYNSGIHVLKVSSHAKGFFGFGIHSNNADSMGYNEIFLFNTGAGYGGLAGKFYSQSELTLILDFDSLKFTIQGDGINSSVSISNKTYYFCAEIYENGDQISILN